MRTISPASGVERHVSEAALLVSMTDAKGVITYCNQEFCQLSGYRSSELIGMPHNILRHPDVPAEIFAECWSTIKTGKLWNGFLKNRCSNGDYYWVEANITPLFCDDGSLKGYVSFSYKLSDHHEIEIIKKEALHNINGINDRWPDLKTRPHSSCVVQLQQRLAGKIVELERYQERNEEDQEFGDFIISRMLKMDEKVEKMLCSYSKSAERLSGDALIAAETPAKVLQVMLADAVGHGLAAAINVQPVCRAFMVMTQKGFSIEHIAEELNELANVNMPSDRFISAALVSINFESQVIEVLNFGLPPLYLISQDGKVLREWESKYPPLGVINASKFTAKQKSFWFEEGCQMFMCSDGFAEGRNLDSTPFDFKSIPERIKDIPYEHRFKGLVREFEWHIDELLPHDDVSLAMIDIEVRHYDETKEIERCNDESELVDWNWNIALTLGAAELRYLDVVPLMTQLLSKVRAIRAHHSALFLILTEMFNNALDHGILRLDSAMKNNEDGFDDYMKLRDKRLKTLKKGHVSVEIGGVVEDGQPFINIRIVDSGHGFDHQAAINEVGVTRLHGRGIILTQSLAHRLEYIGNGNEVRICYSLSSCV